MDAPEPSALQAAGGLALLLALFAAREVVAGALREAGKDLWERAKRHPERTRARSDDGRSRRSGARRRRRHRP